MKREVLSFSASDGVELQCYRWVPDTAPIAKELQRVAPYTSLLEMGYLEAVSIFSDSSADTSN